MPLKVKIDVPGVIDYVESWISSAVGMAKHNNLNLCHACAGRHLYVVI